MRGRVIAQWHTAELHLSSAAKLLGLPLRYASPLPKCGTGMSLASSFIQNRTRKSEINYSDFPGGAGGDHLVCLHSKRSSLPYSNASSKLDVAEK